jgi:hypothetical protein
MSICPTNFRINMFDIYFEVIMLTDKHTHNTHRNVDKNVTSLEQVPFTLYNYCLMA